MSLFKKKNNTDAESSADNFTSKKKRGGAAAITCLMVLFAVVLGYVLTGFLYFKTHFNPGTVISGISCSGKTADSVVRTMSNAAIEYDLILTDNDQINETITASDIGLRYNLTNEIDQVLSSQKPLLWGVGFFKKTEVLIDDAIAYDEDKLKQTVDSLELVKNQQDYPPTNPTITYDGEKYVISEGEHGGKIQIDNLYDAVESAAENLTDSIDLVESECYEMPAYSADSAEVVAACEQANAYIKPKITMNMGPGAEHVIVDKDLINTWLFVTADYNVYFDRKKVAQWVNEFADSFDTYGQTREFLTAFGSRTTVSGGDFGWLVDREAEVQSIVNVVKAGEDVVRYPVYKVMGVGHGQDDIGKSYVEVDLTNQHIYVWVEGKRVLDAPCVTGLPPKRITPPGTFRIKKKLSPAILVGDNYRTPVSYWMPFNQGIGLHDATWQSSFGGKRYLTHGSHGCVNLSLSTAKQVYGYVYPGMPVVCYYTKESGVGTMMELPDPSTTTTTTTTTETTTETTTITTTTKVTTTKAQAKTTTKAPQPTTKAPQTTTKAPVTTTKAPVTTQAQPVMQTQAPVQTTTQAPTQATTQAQPVTEPPTQPTTQAPTETTTKKQENVIVEPTVDDEDEIIKEIVVE